MEVIDVTFRESVLCHKQLDYKKVIETIKRLAPHVYRFHRDRLS